TYKLTLDARGAILKDEGFDADPHLPAVRLALLGRHLFALPAPPPAGRTANAALTVLHDLESGGQRFNLKDDTTAHDIPVSLSSAASGGGLEVTGAVAPGAKADLGKPRREFHVPGTAFTGECRGLWKDGGWVQTSWKTRGSATVKMEGKPVEVELHSRYAARRLP
ncbi:MAG TPA: hypothetical protein VEJ18_17405, partial [Planctomycetota bacterium]|nr:hypothetical protein [Planctomycetota bacterium]